MLPADMKPLSLEQASVGVVKGVIVPPPETMTTAREGTGLVVGPAPPAEHALRVSATAMADTAAKRVKRMQAS